MKCGDEMKAFIIGTGRCGSSMLAQILNSHSMVCVPFELQILFEYSNNGAGLYEVFQQGKNEYFRAEDFIELIESKCPHKFYEYFDYKSFFAQQDYPILSLKELVNNLFNKIAESKRKKIFVEQTPWYGQRIDILNELFPDAKYIHMVRDGRDVALSYARTPWWHDDIGQNLERWQLEVSQIINSSQRILKPNQMLQVHYEDFVEHPERELRHICDFLEINFENNMLDPASYIDYVAYSKLNTENIFSSAQNEWAKNKDVPTFTGSRYAWKKHPDFDFSKMPEHIAKNLKSLGYQTKNTFFDILMAIFSLKGFRK